MLWSPPTLLQDAMDSLQSESEQVHACAGRRKPGACCRQQHGACSPAVVRPAAAAAAQLACFLSSTAARHGSFRPSCPVPHLLLLCSSPCSSCAPCVQARALREIRSRDPAFDMVTFLRNLKQDVRTLIKVGAVCRCCCCSCSCCCCRRRRRCCRRCCCCCRCCCRRRRRCCRRCCCCRRRCCCRCCCCHTCIKLQSLASCRCMCT